MRPSLTPLGPSVSRDRVITSFPKWYTPAACLQLREHFHGQVSAACQRGNTGTVGLRLSKVVVVGDLYVGKTCLIHRFCKNVFNHDYKATIGVDFEIERFEVAGTPFSLQIWDTAGQEKFKCIASAYYRGAQVIITAFDLTDVQTLEHARQVQARQPPWAPQTWATSWSPTAVAGGRAEGERAGRLLSVPRGHQEGPAVRGRVRAGGGRGRAPGQRDAG
nr:ras-related protein Rab-36 isoform X6 [Odocoileus virginianus texanus]XP_020763027.1 ras-related protein Rab-36 isoform X6 [Odocoileus virginianus texanus]